MASNAIKITLWRSRGAFPHIASRFDFILRPSLRSHVFCGDTQRAAMVTGLFWQVEVGRANGNGWVSGTAAQDPEQQYILISCIGDISLEKSSSREQSPRKFVC